VRVRADLAITCSSIALLCWHANDGGVPKEGRLLGQEGMVLK